MLNIPVIGTSVFLVFYLFLFSPGVFRRRWNTSLFMTRGHLKAKVGGWVDERTGWWVRASVRGWVDGSVDGGWMDGSMVGMFVSFIG